MSTKTYLLNQINPVLFWDININQLDAKRDAFYIIKRIITQGDKKDRDLIFNYYTNQQIKQVVNQTRELPDGLKQIWLEILE